MLQRRVVARLCRERLICRRLVPQWRAALWRRPLCSANTPPCGSDAQQPRDTTDAGAASPDAAVVLYHSDTPTPVKAVAVALSLQALATLPVAAFLTYHDVAGGWKVGAMLATLGRTLENSGRVTFVMQPHVVGLGSTHSGLAGQEMVTFVEMGMFKRRRTTVPRSECEGADETATIATCRTSGTVNRTYYLLPSNWWSDDQQALKNLLYEPYFKPPPPPVAARDLIAIEGFGSFRPAQVADPHHPIGQKIAAGEDVQALLAGTSYRVRDDGCVVTDFVKDEDGDVLAFDPASPPLQLTESQQGDVTTVAQGDATALQK